MIIYDYMVTYTFNLLIIEHACMHACIYLETELGHLVMVLCPLNPSLPPRVCSLVRGRTHPPETGGKINEPRRRTHRENMMDT